MAINNNYYSVVNELVRNYTQAGAIGSVVNYSTFVDAGRTMQEISGQDLKNGYLDAFMDKVQLTKSAWRPYSDTLLTDMLKGTIRGGLIEMALPRFTTVQASSLIGLTDTPDDAMIEYKQPQVDVDYFHKDNGYKVTVSISDTELRAAWRSPEALDAFQQTILGATSNSNQLAIETARLATLASCISDIAATGTPNSTAPRPVNQWVDLLGIYNTVTGSTLTKTNCLFDKDFVRWCVSFINEFKQWMRRPSTSLNSSGLMTFTPRDVQRTKISADFDAAIRRSVWQLYNTEGAMLEGYEVLPYWGYQEAPSANGVYVTEDSKELVDVMAVVYDDLAVGEWINISDVSSERNNMKHYTTYWFNEIRRYTRYKRANFVMFTLGTSYAI